MVSPASEKGPPLAFSKYEPAPSPLPKAPRTSYASSRAARPEIFSPAAGDQRSSGEEQGVAAGRRLVGSDARSAYIKSGAVCAPERSLDSVRVLSRGPEQGPLLAFSKSNLAPPSTPVAPRTSRATLRPANLLPAAAGSLLLVQSEEHLQVRDSQDDKQDRQTFDMDLFSPLIPLHLFSEQFEANIRAVIYQTLG